MEGMIKWLLIGGVGYVVGREIGVFPGGSLLGGFLGVQNVAPAISSTTTPITSQSVATPATTIATQAAPSQTMTQLLALATADGTMQKQGGMLGYDQWNYFLQKIIPSPIINWENTPASKNPRSQLYTLDQFWGFVNAAGISGLGMLWEHPMLQRMRSGGGMVWEKALASRRIM